jgi:hypothetical protein
MLKIFRVKETSLIAMVAPLKANKWQHAFRNKKVNI